MKNFQRYAQNTIYEIERLEVYYKEHRYPCKKVLETGKNLMLAVVQIQSAMDFFTMVSKKRDDFYDFAEDYEPIKAFFAGEQLTIFTRALDTFTAEEEAQIFQLKQDNKLDEVFRILFLKQCNALNEILPALFEKTKNYTELLLSLSVIDQDGVVYHLIHDIPEDDFNIERGLSLIHI